MMEHAMADSTGVDSIEWSEATGSGDGTLPSFGGSAQREVETKDEIYRIVRALRRKELSRNRHFELHASEAGRVARRVHRFLRGVERDLRRASEVRVARRPDGGVRLELQHAALRARRTIDLDARAHALLLEDAGSAALLR
jgi:hypothetical protein